MNSSVKLIDTQLMVLSAASQREDQRVIMPDKLRGTAASKLLATLTSKGMIELVAQSEEVGGAPGASSAGLTNYRISVLGLARIGVGEVEPIPATASDAGQISGPYAERASPAVEDPAKSASRGDQGRDEEAADSESVPVASNVTAGYPMHASDSARSDLSKTPANDSEVGAPGSSNRPPRAGSKLDRVIVLLSSDTGATIDELISLTGWLPHTARAALTGLRHRGYDVRLERGDKARGSVYRVVFARAIAS